MPNDLLHIELLPDNSMNFKIKGNPVTVCNMIANAMDTDQEIAAAMIAGVMAWADKNHIPRDQLGTMVKFHL
ncbi:MAG: hypothetical protein ABIQ88_02300 [Chitinophagaceae bacterium]